MQCPVCAKESEGQYCPACGAPLQGAACEVCEAPLLPGARYCTQCGSPVRDRPSPLPWFVAGAAIVALILVLLLPAIREGRPFNPFAAPRPDAPREEAMLSDPAFTPPTRPGTPPPLTGTPREQADRLFNRIMEERASGNTQQAQFFLPMAISAYQQASPLDDDGLYHLSLLEAAARQSAAARASAERILARSPDHLLGLAAAAEAATDQGDTAAARGYFQRFLDRYDAEIDRPLPEYQDHQRVLPEYRRAAETMVRGQIP
jgi:hypothetical protein